MSYTQKLFDIDVSDAIAELDSVQGFNKTLRELHESSAHKEVTSINLRVAKSTGDDIYDYFHNIESIDTEALSKYKHCMDLVDIVAYKLDAIEIARVLVAKLPANKKIDRHRDEGAYPDTFERLHICLNGDCKWNGEKMEPGSVYWVDNSDYHEVIAGSQDRTNIIVDLRCKNGFK